jgi:uracil-DNA glycosylase
MATLEALLAEVRACRRCAPALAHEPRPVLRARAGARLLIAGQAPGRRVHETGVPWNDASGDRLRDWLELDRAAFQDEARIAILPMGFCYPGTVNGADLAPRRECAPLWRDRLLAALPEIRLTLLVGSYAIRWRLGLKASEPVAPVIRAFSAHAAQGLFPLPHPSWRNTSWLKKNPWFQDELLPVLRSAVRSVLA